MHKSTQIIITSNRVSCLFFSGTDDVGIEKMRSKFFSKEKKQQRSGYAAPPAVEAKVTIKGK